MPEIQMPKLSDTMTEGTLVAWKKKKNPKLRRRNPRRLKRKRRKPYRRSKKMQGRLCQPSGLKGSSRKLDPEKKSAKRRA